MALLEVEGLRTAFPAGGRLVPAVDGVGLQIEAGEVLGLVGESGSGKSVTAFSIMRLVAAPGAITAGRVRFEGRDLLTLDDRAIREIRGRHISMIFQDPLSSLNPIQPIGRQVMEPLLLHALAGRREARERALAMLARVGIPDAARRFHDYPHQLSGGLRQRVMIAIALICEPKVLIADEPTTALDVTIQAQIIDLLRRLRSELGMAIIMITHDLGVIAEIADRVNVMYAGQIVESAPVEAFFDAPAHPYSAGLLQSVPDIEHEQDRLSAISGTVPRPEEFPAGCRFAPRCPRAVRECFVAPPAMAVTGPGRAAACIRPLAHHG